MTNRCLYHFPRSAFSRRARLALAHKGLSYDLVDARAEPEKRREVQRICPIPTVPILVEPDGSALGDSTAIAVYLDRAYPDAPALFPTGAQHARAAVEATALVDVALNTIVDLGTRYFPLRNTPPWEGVKSEMLGRAQSALDALAARAASRTKTTWTGAGWSVADMWITSAVLWIEGWPGRAKESELVAQLLTIGLKLPAELSRWTDAHRGQKDIVALG